MVIGSGFGGLAAAVRMRAQGYRVLLLEARDQLGGRAAVFERDGHVFDAGPTVITAPYLLEELFALAGRDMRDFMELVPVDPFYRLEFDDGSTFDCVREEERILANIREMSPPDVDNYLRMVKHMEAIFDIGYTQLVDEPFERFTDMMKVVPDMLRLGNHRSVYGMVSRYLVDERLRQAFTFQPLLIGGNPFKASSIYTLIHWLERKWGVYFALGGTNRIVHALVALLEGMGVEVRTNSPVDEIEVVNGRATAVRLAGGQRIECRMVVSNADPSFVYTRLIGPEHRRKHTDRAVGRRHQSMSLFVAYFGTKKQYPELAHHTIVLGPRYRGLLDDIFDNKVLSEDFSLYLHAPTRTDPSLAPPGHETFYVLSPVPNNESGLDWSKEGQPYFERIMDALERRMLPGLKENLTTSFFVTPDYFEEELRSVSGAAFGIEPRLSQSAWFRYHNRSEDVAGLYFVGASTHPGAGVPGVLNTAKVLEKLVPRLDESERVPLPSSRRVAV
ncbi:MAG: phytoene desaturase [Myxococcales bacterium]|nr:phytoene desaturase [Myxococcales bacterium]